MKQIKSYLYKLNTNAPYEAETWNGNKIKSNEQAKLYEAALNGYVTFGRVELIKSWSLFPRPHSTEQFRYAFVDEKEQIRCGVSGLKNFQGKNFEGKVAILFYQDKSYVLTRYELL